MRILKHTREIIYFLILMTLGSSILKGQDNSQTMNNVSPRLGIWITVFTEQEVLQSRENVDRLLDNCSKCGITDIYLQIYRANKAYYNSDITDKTAYTRSLDNAGTDTISYMLNKTRGTGIKVYAWVNVLSLAKNEQAHILGKYGKDILTYDQYGNTSLHVTKGFVPEHQLFLEAGDYRVREYTGNILKEILSKYPGFSGIHLDYIRYPVSLPYIPGARFTQQGISYGYNRFNLLNFKNETGLEPGTMDMSRKKAHLWDKWRRDQVTKLVKYLYTQVKTVSPGAEISCAVVPSIDKAYLVTFQNWPEWLRKGLIDYVVFMNYTENNDYMKIRAESVLFPDLKEKLQIGLGAYLMREDMENLKKQIITAKNLSPDGIVIFSYDDIAENQELKNFLQKNFTVTEKK